MAESNKNENTTLVNFRVDTTVKESAEAVLSGMGLNMSSYIGMCLRQIAQDRRIPFSPNVDAEFWMAENAVSEAMKLIDSGLFAKALEADEEISTRMNKAMFDAVNNDCFSNPHFATIAVIADEIGVMRYDELYETFNAAKIPVGNDADQQFCDIIDGYLNAIETVCVRFLKENGMHSDGMSIVQSIKMFDKCLTIPVFAYDNYKENLSLRFAGAGSDMDSYEDVAKYSDKLKENKQNYIEKRQAARNNKGVTGNSESLTDDLMKTAAMMQALKEMTKED